MLWTSLTLLWTWLFCFIGLCGLWSVIHAWIYCVTRWELKETHAVGTQQAFTGCICIGFKLSCYGHPIFNRELVVPWVLAVAGYHHKKILLTCSQHVILIVNHHPLASRKLLAIWAVCFGCLSLDIWSFKACS